jgi:hypothetical protein
VHEQVNGVGNRSPRAVAEVGKSGSRDILTSRGW